MITNLQRDVMTVFEEILALAPELRMGQLMAHLGLLGEVHLDRGLGIIDDDELLSVLYRHRDELLARMANTASLPVSHPSTVSSTFVAAS